MQTVRSPGLDLADLPPADALVIHADTEHWPRMRSTEPEKGRPVLLLQGYSLDRARRVNLALRDADRVVAVSRWLEAKARRAGCAVRLVRPGLDRSVFAAGPPADTRPPMVAMLAQQGTWKAARDGIAALHLLRQQLPEVRVVVFGRPPPDCELDTFEAPTRRQFATALRETAVLVQSSRCEGLGLPGIEALACRAALATTDTRGSRDYAIDGETALVVPPGDVEALAGAATTLLTKRSLCRRLADAGHAHVLATYPPWPVAAERFLDALVNLTGR